MMSKTQPKCIDKWVFAHLSVAEQADRVRHDKDDDDEVPTKKVDKRVEISVFIIKDLEEIGSAPHATKGVSFKVTCEDPKIELYGTDIESLRAAAFSECAKRYEVKWYNYFLVTVLRTTIGEGYVTGLDFSYTDVRKGITHDGRELLRRRRWGGDVEIKPWPGQFTDKEGRAMACIPDTPENRTALEEFAKRIDLLRERIKDTLKPENIVHTLAHLSQNALLPGTEVRPEKTV